MRIELKKPDIRTDSPISVSKQVTDYLSNLVNDLNMILSQIDTDNLSANLSGKLNKTVVQSTSDLDNDAGYIDQIECVRITKDTIDTPYLNAKKIKAGSVDAENITGTKISGKVIESQSSNTGTVTIEGGELSSTMYDFVAHATLLLSIMQGFMTVKMESWDGDGAESSLGNRGVYGHNNPSDYSPVYTGTYYWDKCVLQKGSRKIFEADSGSETVKVNGSNVITEATIDSYIQSALSNLK